MSEPLVAIETRQGRKLIQSGSITLSGWIDHLLNMTLKADEAINCRATLKAGSTFKFKGPVYSYTIKPLHNHIDNY